MTRRWMSSVWIVLAGTLALAGCSSDSSGPSGSTGQVEDEINLEDSFGGYTTSDELPAFGDAELAQTAELEAEVSDPIARDSYVERLEADPNTRIYAMSLAWGMLERESGPNDEDLGEEVDWGGSLRIDSGAIVLQRVVAFERGDHVILPRADRTILEWESRTYGHWDGIRVLILQPADSVNLEPELVFETGPHTQTFLLSELSDLDEVVDVDKSGNKVHFLSTETDLSALLHGWLAGRWNWNNGDDVGRFSGRWVSAFGVVGFVRGHYGFNEEGEPRFFGKYIDRSGNFQGFLRGLWTAREGNAHRGVGIFRGGWHSATGEAEGLVAGHWISAPEHAGFFAGRWCGNCRDEIPETDLPDDGGDDGQDDGDDSDDDDGQSDEAPSDEG